MLNFRDFSAGPDPFGRTFHVLLKWMQTAISIRHSDTVDACFILESGDERQEKTIAMPHADLVKLSSETGHEMTDPWCTRLAAMHLIHLVETGEDLEKNLVTVTWSHLKQYAEALGAEEKEAIRRGAA